MTPQLISANTYHRRLGGPANAFRYSLDFVLCEPDATVPLPLLFSRNKFNLAAVHDVDHGGPRAKGRGADWVREKLREQGLVGLAGMKILLLAQPRALGHVFNPVSFWLIVDDDDQLRAFIAEVNNTFGDRHSYLCHHDTLRPIRPQDTLSTRKVFHVSPFQDVDGTYSFRVNFTSTHISIRIDHRRGNSGLLATLNGKRAQMTNRALIWSALRRPFGAGRILALIYWQAGILYLKKAPFWRRPEPPTSEIS